MRINTIHYLLFTIYYNAEITNVRILLALQANVGTYEPAAIHIH